MTPLSGAHVAALAVSLVACVFDLRTRRIPNWLTFGTAAAAILYQLLSAGAGEAGQSAGGWLLGVALLIVPYALGGMGAGDVKLVGALGALLGPRETFWLAMYTGMAGAIVGLIVSAWHGCLRQTLRNVWLMLMHWRVNGLRPVPELTLATSQGPRLAYAVPILLGTVAMVWLR